MNKRKGTTVRLTESARTLLLKKAGDYKVSMKELASEAVILLVDKKDKFREQFIHFERVNEASIKLQKRIPIYLFISAAVGAIAGIFIGVVL